MDKYLLPVPVPREKAALNKMLTSINSDDNIWDDNNLYDTFLLSILFLIYKIITIIICRPVRHDSILLKYFSSFLKG